MKAADRIEHVVVLMLENRSFDHVLGTIPGVDGVLDAKGNVKPECFNLRDPLDPSSTKFPAKLGASYFVPPDQTTSGGEFGGPSHSFPSATQQLFGTNDLTKGRPKTTPATNCGFVQSYIGELRGSAMGKAPTDDAIVEVMSVFTQDQLPVISALAKEFTVCDRWFSEVPGPTEPNRLFMHAATSTGLTYNPWKYDPLTVDTVYDRLTAKGLDWSFYYQDLSDAVNFTRLADQTQSNQQFDAFFGAVKGGALPFYSFLCPRYSDAAEGRANSQHAPLDVRYGEWLIADVYEALRASALWEKSLLVVTYDEHGGYHDHVFPPEGIASPDGLTSPNAFMKQEAGKGGKAYLTGSNYGFDFTRLGCRVPSILVSPWIAKGKVDSTQYQHTSVLATLRQMHGIEPLTRRDAQAVGFAQRLEELDSPRQDCPVTLKRPPLPDAQPAKFMSQAPTAKQVELANRMTAHLKGHADTNPEKPRDFATSEELNRYVRERQAAHERHAKDRRRRAKYEIHEKGGQHWWRLKAGNGEVIAKSDEGYSRRADCEKAIQRVRSLAPHASQTDA